MILARLSVLNVNFQHSQLQRSKHGVNQTVTCVFPDVFLIVRRLLEHLIFFRNSISKIIRYMSFWRAALSLLANDYDASPLGSPDDSSIDI